MFEVMCTTPVQTPTLLATFTNERLGLCASVRELPDDQFEVAVIDALTGGIVVSRTFSTEDGAIEMAKRLSIGIEVYG